MVIIVAIYQQKKDILDIANSISNTKNEDDDEDSDKNSEDNFLEVDENKIEEKGIKIVITLDRL